MVWFTWRELLSSMMAPKKETNKEAAQSRQSKRHRSSSESSGSGEESGSPSEGDGSDSGTSEGGTSAPPSRTSAPKSRKASAPKGKKAPATIDGGYEKLIKRVDSGFKQVRGEIGKLDAKFGQLQHEVQNLQHEVQNLVTATPTAYASRYHTYVIRQEGLTEFLTGTSATWTCVFHKNKWYLLGAAHCIFYYGLAVDSETMFAQLPKEVVQKCGVVKVLVSSQLLHPGPHQYRYDFVAVELRQPPIKNLDRRAAPRWPLAPTKDCSFESVAGTSTSGPVVGGSTRYVPEEGIYVFLETEGERGHSGTLMATPDGTPLGVYYGNYGETPAGLRWRGVIVPPPHKLVALDVLPLTKDTTYATPSNQYSVKPLPETNGVLLVDKNTEWAGVMLGKRVWMHGASVCGNACRCA